MVHELKLFFITFGAFFAGVCSEAIWQDYGLSIIIYTLMADIIAICITMIIMPVSDKAKKVLEVQTYITVGLVASLYLIVFLQLLFVRC